MKNSSSQEPGNSSKISILSQHAYDSALHLQRLRGYDDRRHSGIRRLQADLVAFAIEAFKRSLRALDQSDDDIPIAGGLGAFHHHIVAIYNVLILHGIAAHYDDEDFQLACDDSECD